MGEGKCLLLWISIGNNLKTFAPRHVHKHFRVGWSYRLIKREAQFRLQLFREAPSAKRGNRCHVSLALTNRSTRYREKGRRQMEASCWKTRPDTRIERCFHLTHTKEDWERSRGHFLCVCVSFYTSRNFLSSRPWSRARVPSSLTKRST